MTIQMTATEQYFPMVMLVMLHEVVLTFDSMDFFFFFLILWMKSLSGSIQTKAVEQ